MPKEPYPHLNELPFTIAIHKMIWWDTAKKAAKAVAWNWGMPFLGTIAAGVWYWLQ